MRTQHDGSSRGTSPGSGGGTGDRSDADHQAWVIAALEQNQQRLTAYCIRLLHGKVELAQEIVQQSFLKLCHQDRQVIGENVTAWLFRVCRNHAYDELRKMKVSGENNGLVARPNFVESDPTEQLQRKELLQNVQLLISELPDDQREAIELWSHGVRFKEIAEVIGKTEGAVRVVVHRAIKSLRDSAFVKSYLSDDQWSQQSLNPGTTPSAN